MNIVNVTKSNNTITVMVNDNGVIKPIPATSEHPKWNEILEAWKNGNNEKLLDLLSMKRVVEQFSQGGLMVADAGVFYNNVPLTGIDVDRIMAFLRNGEPYQPIANYMVRKLANPSRRAIKEMYNFLEHKNMPLTPEGKIIAYKGVQKDFYSVSSGKEPLLQGKRNESGQIFNGVGEVIEMPRSEVDDDFRQGCSQGLHAGSLSYAKDWARSCQGIIILIEIDPSDVVSVPDDCQCQKLRCNKYKVIGTYDGPLPDTYTADYSDIPESDEPSEPCDVCGETECICDECPECGYNQDDCQCNNDTCDRCGEDVSNCSCERCDGCDNLVDDCTCDKDPRCGCGSTDCPDCGAGLTNTPVTLPQPKEHAPELKNVIAEPSPVRTKVVSLICEQIGCSPNDVTDDKTFVDLGFDSLDGVEFVMFLEEAFKMDISDEDAGKFENGGTVGQVIAALEKVVCCEPKTEVTEKVSTNPPVTDSYQQGYQQGFRNGVRRRARVHREGDENNKFLTDPEKEFARGYNAGYRAGRKDYKH